MQSQAVEDMASLGMFGKHPQNIERDAHRWLYCFENLQLTPYMLKMRLWDVRSSTLVNAEVSHVSVGAATRAPDASRGFPFAVGRFERTGVHRPSVNRSM